MGLNANKISHQDYFKRTITNLALKPAMRLDTQTSLYDTISLMQEKRFGSVVLTTDDVLQGIFTERDILFRILNNPHNPSSPISDYMVKNPYRLKLTHSVEDCIRLMSRYNFRHIPIVDEKNFPFHVLSIKDILNHISKLFSEEMQEIGRLLNLSSQGEKIEDERSFVFDKSLEINKSIFLSPISRILLRDPLVLDHESSLLSVINEMQKIRSGVVLLTRYDAKLAGIFTERDAMLKVYNKIPVTDYNKVSIGEFMTKNPSCLTNIHFVAYAINNMFIRNFRNIPIVDEQSFPLGVISLDDILKFIAHNLFHLK